jgi:hypothetical protein
VRRYVILEQSRAAAAVFSRDNGDWAATLLNSADASLDMPEIGLTIPLADIYAGVGFEADT